MPLNSQNFSWKKKDTSNKTNFHYEVIIKYPEFTNWQLEKQQNSELPGFRKGKAPLSMFKKEDFLKQIAQKMSEDIIQKEKLERIYASSFSQEKFEENADIVMELNLEILPNMPEIKYEELKLEEKVAKIAKKDVEEKIKEYCKVHCNFEEPKKKRKSEKGDLLSVGVTVDNNTEKVEIVLGNYKFIKEVEDELIGRSEGEEIEHKAPDVIIKLKVEKIQHPVELTKEEAAKKLKIEENELESFFEKKIEEQAKYASENLMINKITKKLANEYELETPESLRRQEFQKLYSQVLHENGFQEGNDIEAFVKEKLKTTKTELEKSIKENADTIAKIKLMLEYEAFRQKIELEKDEVENLIRQEARFFKNGLEEAKKFFEKNLKARESLVSHGLQRKVLKHILKQVKKQQKEVALKELFS